MSAPLSRRSDASAEECPREPYWARWLAVLTSLCGYRPCALMLSVWLSGGD